MGQWSTDGQVFLSRLDNTSELYRDIDNALQDRNVAGENNTVRDIRIHEEAAKVEQFMVASYWRINRWATIPLADRGDGAWSLQGLAIHGRLFDASELHRLVKIAMVTRRIAAQDDALRAEREMSRGNSGTLRDILRERQVIIDAIRGNQDYGLTPPSMEMWRVTDAGTNNVVYTRDL